jgi:hypothetical protein
MHFQ